MRIAMFCLAVFAAGNAGGREFTSGATRTHLLELFTSEGCSSCPPAEAWLGELRGHRGVWRTFVPVAWHVDYWDRLGWKDRFALRAATERQHAFASAWRSANVYTPCLVVDGSEWHGRKLPDPDPRKVGVLKARLERDQLEIDFAAESPGNYEAHAVILALGAVTKVTQGENRGRNLQHEFVATHPPRSAVLRDQRTAITLPVPAVAGVSDYALAVWVTRRGELVPVQATGGMLAEP